MCVTHNNIARGDSLIAFALTISESLLKITLSHFQFYIFAKEIVLFFFFFQWQWSSAILEMQQSYLAEKMGFFDQIFFPDFFLHLAVVLLFLGSHILGKGMFSKRRLFIYFLFVFFFERKFLLFLFFSARNIIKSWEERKRSEIERKMEK